MACKKQLLVKLNQPVMEDGQFRYTAPVNCGKCAYCKKQRITGWAFRMEQEARDTNNAFFVTLTYDSQNIPYCKIEEDAKIRKNGNLENKYSEEEIKENITKVPTLKKADVQNFIKRLRIIEQQKYGHTHKVIDNSSIPIRDVFIRKLHNETYDIKKPLKYYATGEYGTNNRRPHYHIIIFNIYDTESIDEAWQMGVTETKPTHENSISYALKYLEKESKHYKYIYAMNLQPEFSLSSKRLGANYITPSTKAYHISDYNNNVITLKNGVKGKIPRYIHNKLYKKITSEELLSDVPITPQQQKEDIYIKGLYKHIKTEAEKKQAQKEKAYGNKLQEQQLKEAKDSLSIKKVKKRD